MAGEARRTPAGAGDHHPQAAPAAPLLLEIGSEDIPARFLPAAVAELRARAEALLTELDLAHAEPRTLAAPRRLALLCERVALRQPDRTLEVKGPPLRVAFGGDGAPTAAAEGFARKNGVALADCFPVQDDKGGYLAARRLLVGRPAAEVLAERLPDLILGLPFPKVMRWGAGAIEYPRPLRWLVALHGDQVVPVRVGDLAAGRESRGHRTLAEDRPLNLEGPAQYLERLREAGVEPDQERRRAAIEAGLAAVAAALPGGAAPVPDPDLLQEVAFLCEWPTVFAGGFDPVFFELPEVVIVTALRQHQRYFAVRGADGALLPHFLAVRDGGELALDEVRRGNERVLRARLSDALFYWRFDQKRTPDEHVERLAAVTWIEGLGTLLDRTRRLETLATQLWGEGFGDGAEAPAALLRAAHLAKADQVTEMIRDGKEFTKLEGTIGAHYARQAGEDEAVCRAVERHYLPRGAADELPGDRISSTLAAADRLDTLAGCWLAGFVPTGAKDPYGLRRHGLALLRIALDLSVSVSLRSLLASALAPFGGGPAGKDPELAAGELHEFLTTRLAVHLVESLGCPAETVRAAMPAHGDDPAAALAWARDLEKFRRRKDFQALATGFKRCQNILEGRLLPPEQRRLSLDRWLQGGRTPAGEDLGGLPEPAEHDLREQVASAAVRLAEAEGRRDRVAILQELSALGPAIDAFFDSVRVNVPDPDLRQRRHAFLREIQALFGRYADFGEVAPEEAG